MQSRACHTCSVSVEGVMSEINEDNVIIKLNGYINGHNVKNVHVTKASLALSHLNGSQVD